MGRQRRRNRRGAPEQMQDASAAAPVIVAETLAPTYVPVSPGAWSAESDTPVLPLEGLKPWDEIRGPAIALDEEQAPRSTLGRDSDDPSQLDLTKLPDETEASIQVIEPPLLVLEAEPPAVVQAELVLEAPVAEEPVLAAPVAEEFLPPPAALEPVVDPVELRFQDARAAEAEGRSAEARLIYRDVIGERPAHLSARNNLALLLERVGDTQGALAEYDRAIELDADHATLLTNRGALLGAMGRYAAAERDLKRVLRNDPSHLEGLFNLGVVMTRKGLWGEAVQQLRRVVEIDPTRGAAYFYLGEALNKVDDLYGAMAAYQRAAELMPDHPRALYGLGIVYDRLGRPDDAARMYRKSREIGKR
jgi:tetratricopeptide (TPR) repeat protein